MPAPAGHSGPVLSLVNSPAVCFDLVRLPGGTAAAGVLAAGLAAGPADLTRLERADRGADRTRARRLASEALSPPAGGSVLAGALAAVSGPLPAAPAAAAVTALLATPLCPPDRLLALLRDDVLDWTWAGDGDLRVARWPRAGALLGDALLAALAAPALAPAAADLLAAPFRAAALPDGPGDLGPQSGQLAALLDGAAALDAPGARDLAAAHAAVGGWAADVHQACWAVHLTGRTRTAARAQVALARVLAARPDRLELAASGALATLSGAVHATVVADVLEGDTAERLLRPWEDVRGTGSGRGRPGR